MTQRTPPVDFKMILCDAAQADQGGKLHMLGAGLTMLPHPVPPHAVAIMIKVPWDRTNEKIQLDLQLLDEDGHPVEVPGATGAEPVRAGAEVEAGRPAGMTKGSEISVVFAMNVAPLPIPPGRYQWRAIVDGETVNESFEVIGKRKPPVVAET